MLVGWGIAILCQAVRVADFMDFLCIKFCNKQMPNLKYSKPGPGPNMYIVTTFPNLNKLNIL